MKIGEGDDEPNLLLFDLESQQVVQSASVSNNCITSMSVTDDRFTLAVGC